MIFDNYYLIIDNNLDELFNVDLSYKYLANKFINKFIFINKYSKKQIDEKQLFNDAVNLSKYYIYWKTLNCTYELKIMNILIYIDNL